MLQTEPETRRWTRDDLYKMADAGLFHGQRAELLEGQIMVLSPQKFAHSVSTDRSTETVRAAFGRKFWVRMQLPISFGEFSEPEPDVSVVEGPRERYTDHPTTALLVVEVSDTTLAYDRGRKASLFASAGIADYWIVNLVDQQLEVYRNPIVDGGQAYGFRYADKSVYHLGQTVTPLALTNSKILVSDLFPA